MLSIVIPIHNEEPAILPLYDRLTAVLEAIHRPYEILFVDDASTDRSFDLLANLVETDHHLKVLRLRRNFGQTAALAAGFDEAQGDVIIPLDGELHRFIPALASFYGARVIEVPIKNIERPNGASHYGLSRTFRVFFDILTIGFLLRYLTRPMHFFGKWGLAGIGLGSVILFGILIEKLWGHDIIAEHGPLLIAGAMLWFAGLMLFSVGLIGEVLMRTYFESQGRRIYAIREVRSRREQMVDGTR